MRLVKDLLLFGKKTLASAGIESWAIDGDLLMMNIICPTRTREELFKLHNRQLDDTMIEMFLQGVERRALREPLAYIIAEKPFWKYIFEISHSVLIPRPESELIVELALRFLAERAPKYQEPLKILDLGTGSGCIIISIVKSAMELGIAIHAVATDISTKAISIAKRNARNLNLDNSSINWMRSNWFSSVKGKFDIIVCNPPYIPAEERANLSDLSYEPKTALFARELGFYNYRVILEQVGCFLKADGIGIFECGINQSSKIAELITSNNLRLGSIHKDLAGIDRVICYEHM